MAPELCIIVARSLTEAIAHLSAGGGRLAAGCTIAGVAAAARIIESLEDVRGLRPAA